jgi:hypothetical protein
MTHYPPSLFNQQYRVYWKGRNDVSFDISLGISDRGFRMKHVSLEEDRADLKSIVSR